MKFSKWSAVILATCLIASVALAGCSSDKQQTADKSNEGAAKAVEFPLKQPIKLKMYANKQAAVKKDYNEMKMFQALHEKSNVDIEWSYGTAKDNTEKKNLIIASNDLPDAFYGAGALDDVDVMKYGIDGLLIPLEDLIAKYAPNLQAVFKKDPSLKKLVTAPDGHIYALPFANMVTDDNTVPSAMYINKKWLDKLNLKMPTTTNELYDVLKAFKEQDPNGNGKPDEIPMSYLSLSDQIWGPLSLAGAFGKAFPTPINKYWNVDNGKVVFAPMLPENRDFLVYMNKLYTEKLIDPEVFTQNKQVYQSKVKSSTPIVGVHFEWSNTDLFGKSETDYVPVPPLKGPNGTSGGWNKQDNNVSASAFAITKVNKYPEATMKWIDLSYEPQTSFQMLYGMFGTYYTEGNNEHSLTAVPTGMTPMDLRVSEAPGPNSVAAVLPGDVKIKLGEGDIEKASLHKLYEPYTVKEWFPRAYLMSADELQVQQQWGLDVTAQNAYLDKQIAKIMTGNDPVGDWNTMVEQLKKYGVDKQTKLAQQIFDRVRK